MYDIIFAYKEYFAYSLHCKEEDRETKEGRVWNGLEIFQVWTPKG